MIMSTANDRESVDYLNQPVIVITKNEKVIFINETACSFLGYKQDELIDYPIKKIIKNEEFFDDQLQIDGLPQTATKRKVKNCLITKNGKKIPAVISEIILQDYDENKETLYFSNNYKERRQSMNEFIFNNVYFDEIFNNVHFSMVLIDNSGKVLYVNKIFAGLFGFKKNETIGKNIIELMSDNDANDEIKENIKKALNGEKVLKEIVRHNKKGKPIDLLILAAPIVVNGQQNGANMVFRDVTAQKNTQRELEKANIGLKDATAKLIHKERMTALGELTSSIAHELNQPLNNMKIILQDIQRDIDKERLDITTIPESICDVIWQINKMARIIDHMRIFTRRLDDNICMEKIDVNVPINNIFLLTGEQLKDKNIEVIKNLNSNLPMISGNITALEQVFMNILINARQAIEESDENRKTIEIASYINDSNEIAVSISNTGKKIPKDIRDRIFEPFFTTKEPGIGTGLGLSISKKIIDEHNGRMELNENNNLTTFTVILPNPKEGEQY